MQADKRAEKKDLLSRNHQSVHGIYVHGKSFSSRLHVGYERQEGLKVDEESNRDTGARTLINHTRTPTHSSVAAKADKKLGGTIRAQIPKGALRKQIDGRSENISKIKARFLARKYSQIWLQFTFGKVSPYLARKLSRINLKKKVFTAWKEEWWTARKEWKLDIRAECHSRYRLWLKVWKGWRQYLKLEQNDKCLQAKAVSYYNKRSLQIIFNGWKKYTDVKRAEKLIYSQIALSSCAMLKRRFFNLWLKRLVINHQIAKLDATALHHWAYNQLLKAWVEWRNQLQQRISLHQRMHVLIWNHQVRSLRRCWNGWTLYVELCKTKKRNKGVAEEQFNLLVMTKYFNQWLKRHKRVQEIALFHEQLAHKERLARLQRVFNHWKHYIIIKHYYRRLNEISNQYYTRKSKVLVFKGLRLFVNLKQQKEIYCAQAVKHRRSMLLNSFWQCWIRRCDHSEEIKMLPQSRLAFNHFRKVILMQFITKWKHYIMWRRHRKEQYCVAEKHFRNKIIPKAFGAFRQHVDICEYKQHIVTAAYKFRRENLLSMVFYYWWRSCVHHQDTRMMERMAILHSEETIKKNILTIWRLKTKQTLESSDLQRRADDQNYYRVMSKMLYQWKLFCQLSHHKREIKFKATICYKLKLLRLAWNGWEKYLDQQKTKYQQWQKASDHHSLMLMKKVFLGYKCYHKRQLIKKDLNTQAFSFYCHHTLRNLCRSWKVFVLQQQALRSMKIQASLYNNGKIINKVWTNWKNAKKYQVSLRELEDEKVVFFQKKLEYSYTIRAFFTWKYHRDQRIVYRFKWKRSTSLYRQTILHKCLIAWSQYSRLRVHKLSLKQSSSWFYINRLKVASYSHWRLQLMRILIQRQKNTLALWQWSQILQRKVMFYWLEYTEYRKQRHKRYNDAMEYYRKTLLNIGITEWIRVATWQATERQERALEKQTKNVQSTIMCVRRCAQHWRKWAHRQKSPLDQWQHCDNSNNSSKNISSHKAINGMNAEWISIVKKLNVPIATASGGQKKRPQPRKPNFLVFDNFIDNQGSATLQSIPVEHLSLNAAESVESVPRKEVFPLSHPCTIQHEFAFLPSSPSEASLIAVNSTEDQQLLDLKRKDLSIKQSTIIPLPPSAFKLKHTNSSEHFPLQTDKPTKQQKLSSEEILQTDKQTKLQEDFQDQVSQSIKHQQSISELTAIDIQLKNLTLNQEILYIKIFLKKYHSIKETLRIIEDKIKHLKTTENSPRGTLKQLQEEQAAISSALELHKPLMLRMVARSNELQMHYQ